MPWESVKLNDGHNMPTIAFGTWKTGSGQGSVDQVEQAISVGFSHIDTAQAYRNETEAGKGIRESGLSRSEIFITTKYSGVDGLDIETSIRNSLKNLGVEYVDLYLIHFPRLAQPDMATAWVKMEKLKADGLTKSIGVSNFQVADLVTLLASAKVKPAVNQILLHPYVLLRQLPILNFCAAQNIVAEAYSVLIPLTHETGGPVDPVLEHIGKRVNASPDMVLLAWAKAKGAVVVTASSKKARLEGYLTAGDLELDATDIASIDSAGAQGSSPGVFDMLPDAKTLAGRAVMLALCVGALYIAGGVVGIV